MVVGLYVGITVYVEEACRLLSVTLDDDGRRWWPTPALVRVETIAARTSLRLISMDKGLCVLGLEVPHIDENFTAPVRDVDECVALILLTKSEWKREVARIKMDLRSVTIAHMEAESEVVENPQPALFVGVL